MPSAAGSDVNAAEMGRFAQCDASADRRTPLGARGAGGKDRRIHRVLVTPSRVARANRVTSAGSVARCPPAIDSNASSVERAPRRASEALSPELLWVLQPRSVSICATPVSRVWPDSPAARPRSRNHPAWASKPLPSGSRSSTEATSSRGRSATARARAVGANVPLALRSSPTS